MRGKQQSSGKKANKQRILRRFPLNQIKLKSHKNVVRTRTRYSWS